MSQIKRIKVTEDFIMLVQKMGFKSDYSEKESYCLSKEKTDEILKMFGFNQNDKVELNDFFEFSKHFGFDKERYLLLKPLKEKAEVTWEDIKNIKYGDIDFENNTITFPNQRIKNKLKKYLGR